MIAPMRWTDVPLETRAQMLASWDSTEVEVEDSDSDYQMRERSKRKAQTAQRFETLNAFVDITMRELTLSEKIVWVVLYRDVRDGVVTVSQNDIAVRSGLTQSTVSQAINRLVKRGLVLVVRQGGFRKGLSTYKSRGSV